MPRRCTIPREAAVRRWFEEQRKKPGGVTPEAIMAHFKLDPEEISARTVRRRMIGWLGEGGVAAVRQTACAGAINKRDRRQRLAWAQAGQKGRVIVRMDATKVVFPDRNGSGVRKSRRVYRKKNEKFKRWAMQAKSDYPGPHVWIINGIVRTRTRSNNMWGAEACSEMSRTHNSQDVIHYTNGKLARKLRQMGYSTAAGRQAAIPAELDGGKPFQSVAAKRAYASRNLSHEAYKLYPRSGDTAIIENFNGWLKRRIYIDLARKYPNGLQRTKRNFTKFSNFVKKSIKKHSDNKQHELQKYLKKLVNSVQPRLRRLVASGGATVRRR